MRGLSEWRCLLLAVLVLVVGGAGAPGCNKRTLPRGAGGAGVLPAGAAGAGGQGPAGAAGGPGPTGTGGSGGIATACAGASDARLVVAEQRILRLTSHEIVNTIRSLFGTAEAQALLASNLFAVRSPVEMHFPPADGEETNINDTSLVPLNAVAEHVASYVVANFALQTGCAAATDGCAAGYLDRLAGRAYRRQLTPAEKVRLTALYDRLRAPQIVNGYEVTFTVEEATGYAVQALLTSPQMLWRWELGDPAMASAAPAGVPLTDQELATQLAFFLTDHPPDDALLAAANAGTLRANLATHADTLLRSPAARDWLRTVIELYFLLNQLPSVPVDPGRFPIFTNALVDDMTTEARRFLDHALWNGNLTDLLLSRTTFLNTRLARDVYSVPVPAGALDTNFVQTTLPAAQRAGLLTNAAQLTSLGNSDGQRLWLRRARFVSNTLLCMPFYTDDLDVHSGLLPQPPGRTTREEIASRAALPICNGCHAQFDPYGLALDNYDNLGRYRTVDDMGRPIDAHTTLPAAAGGGDAANGVELAEALAAQPAFLNCMASALLQYALVDYSAPVEVPRPPSQAGCATADVVQRYQAGTGRTFTDLARATATAPAFALRRAAP